MPKKEGKERKKKKKTPLGYQFIFVLASLGVTALAKLSNEEIDWHFSFVWLTHSQTQKQHTNVPFIIGIHF